MSDLSHVNEAGEARMVDVTDKAVTHRLGRAAGTITMRPETLAAIRGNSVAKGDVITVAKIAGVMAAKRTAELIPLCHPLPITDVQVSIVEAEDACGLRVEASVRTTGRTGVEMEALTAVSVALLTIYDMAKAMDRHMSLTDICLLEKDGGRTGYWTRQ